MKTVPGIQARKAIRANGSRTNIRRLGERHGLSQPGPVELH